MRRPMLRAADADDGILPRHLRACGRKPALL
jgi:hypothetical protein